MIGVALLCVFAFRIRRYNKLSVLYNIIKKHCTIYENTMLKMDTMNLVRITEYF